MISSSSCDQLSRTILLQKFRLGFNSESGQTKDLKIAIHSFSIRRSALKNGAVNDGDENFLNVKP